MKQKRGEIATILVVAAFIVLGVGTVASSFLANQSRNSGVKAEQNFNCVDRPTFITPAAPGGTHWEADCNNTKGYLQSGPHSPSCAGADGNADSNNCRSNGYGTGWCYGFSGGSSPGYMNFRCMQLQLDEPNATPTSVQSPPTATPANQPTPAADSLCAGKTAGSVCTGSYSNGGDTCYKKNGTCGVESDGVLRCQVTNWNQCSNGQLVGSYCDSTRPNCSGNGGTTPVQPPQATPTRVVTSVPPPNCSTTTTTYTECQDQHNKVVVTKTTDCHGNKSYQKGATVSCGTGICQNVADGNAYCKSTGVPPNNAGTCASSLSGNYKQFSSGCYQCDGDYWIYDRSSCDSLTPKPQANNPPATQPTANSCPAGEYSIQDAGKYCTNNQFASDRAHAGCFKCQEAVPNGPVNQPPDTTDDTTVNTMGEVTGQIRYIVPPEFKFLANKNDLGHKVYMTIHSSNDAVNLTQIEKTQSEPQLVSGSDNVYQITFHFSHIQRWMFKDLNHKSKGIQQIPYYFLIGVSEPDPSNPGKNILEDQKPMPLTFTKDEVTHYPVQRTLATSQLFAGLKLNIVSDINVGSYKELSLYAQHTGEVLNFYDEHGTLKTLVYDDSSFISFVDANKTLRFYFYSPKTVVGDFITFKFNYNCPDESPDKTPDKSSDESKKKNSVAVTIPIETVIEKGSITSKQVNISCNK